MHSPNRHLYRSPDQVMRLARMGAAHQCRLSFMRALVRELKRDNWRCHRSQWQIDASGVGHALYCVQGPQRAYTLIVFSHDLPADMRSDRVIAEAWDVTFTLFDGIPAQQDIERLRAQVPLQEAGRVTESELVLSRANRSVRLFDYVVEQLSQGRQPDREQLLRTGYLMRTTAVYGSGKFGAADRERNSNRCELEAPFRAELLAVWLIRAFSVDLIEHLAQARDPVRAVCLQPDLRRSLGVGNSTGLGMAPFLINHPRLTNNWVLAREEALARVRALEQADPHTINQFTQWLKRAQLNAALWQTDHPQQMEKIEQLRVDLSHLHTHLTQFDFTQPHPWDRLYRWGERQLSLEGQEQLAMLLLEPQGALIDGLSHCMSADESTLLPIDGQMTVGVLFALIADKYAWALAPDYTQPAQRSRFWYVSEEKLEPRVGERFDEPGVELEQPLCIGWHVNELQQALAQCDADESVANFLLQQPEFRHVVRRVQQIEQYPYMEVQDNLISADMMPIDLLRLKLSFFGATRFDPRSDRWLRINMFQHAPFPDEIASMPLDDWVYPPLSEPSHDLFDQ